MSCTINIKGEGKKRFNSLSDKFGARAALETFLQEDGTSDIDGFISDVEEANRVNAITFSAIEGLIEETGGVSVLDLSNLKLESEDVAKAIKSSKMRLERILEDALNSENQTETDKYIAARSFVALENFDQLIPKIKNRFKSLGLTISELNQDLEEAYEEESSENSNKEHIYNLKHLERNRLDSVKPSVKLFLATLPEQRFDEEGNVVESTDDIGMRIPVDFHSLYSILSKNLADKASMDEMYETLENLSDEIPAVQVIKDYLETGVFDSETQSNVDTKKVNSFENAFYNSFANTYNQSLTIAYNTNKNEAGEKKVSTNIFYTDKRRTDRTLKQKWAANAFKLINQPKAVKNRLWQEEVYDVFNPAEKLGTKEKKAAKAKRNKRLKNPNNKTILEEISNSLRLLGMEVDPKALSLLRKKLNKKSKNGFMDFVNKDLPFLAEQMYKNNVNIFKDEGSTINVLAEIQAEITSDLGASAYMNAENNQVYPINLPSYFSELFNELFSGNLNEGRLKEFLQDDFYTNFKLLNDIIQKDHGMQVALFDAITDNDSGMALPFDSLDPVSAMSVRMSLFMNYNAKGKANSKHAWILMPTPADRGSSHAIKIKPLEEGSFPLAMDNLFSDETNLKDWILDMAQSEFNRIKTVRNEFNTTANKDNLISDYHVASGELGNGGYFNYFPGLNQFLITDEAGNLQDIDFNSNEVQEVLQNHIENQVKADLEYFEDIGFIEPLGQKANGLTKYSDFKLSDQAKRSLPSGVANDTNILSFIVNSIIANHEVSAMLQGDLAHFSSVKNDDGSRTASLDKSNKRAGSAFTPGQKLRVGPGGANQTFNVAFSRDVIHESENISTYFSYLNNKQAEKFSKSNSTDGQGLTSLDRYKEILDSQGMLTPALEATINELKKPSDKIDWSKVTEPLVPIKGFHHGLRYDENFDRVMPKNLKYSLYPVVPSAIENNPTMTRISNLMDESNVDELVFESGSKFGAYNFNDVLQGDLTELKTVPFDNRDWRMPQVVPYKNKIEENFGSQIRKLIEANVQLDEYYGDQTGSELLQNYQNAIIRKLELSFADMVKEISENGEISIEKVADKVLDDLANNAYKSTSDFINKALEIIETASGELDTRIPMSFPAIKHKVESSLNSMVRKAVTKQSMPGFNGVVSTALGYNKKAIKVDKTLKFIRKGKNGEILPAEIIVSPQYFANSLREQRKNADDKTKKQINRILDEMNSGKFDLSSIPDSLLEGVVYRIPTQGKNSMLPIKITGFTPEALSTNVILPAEIVTQSGMDYDIDKVYVELRHFSYTSESGFNPVESNTKTKKGVDNTIIDTHYKILTSEHHAGELLTPNHTDTLDNLKEDISEIYSGNTFGRQWSSMATQDDFRDKNQAGSIFIGIASNANTGHALFQNLGVTLRNKGEQADSKKATGVKINGKFVNSLSQTKNRKGGLISDDHAETQNGALDNATNPLLGHLNINSITGSTYLFLTEAGMGLKYPVYLLNTPIIRDLVKRARINEANMGPDGAFEAALSELVEDKDFDISDTYDSDFDVKQGVLEEVIDKAREGQMTSSYDQSILKAFLTFRKYGQDMSAVQGALRTDVKGPGQTFAANVIQASKLARIEGTYSNENYTKRFNLESDDVIKTITLDKSKYDNHSIKTYEELGLWGAIDLVGRFIADSTPAFNQVLNGFNDLIGNVTSEADVRLLMNDFYTYLFANQNAHVEGKRSILAESDSETVAELLLGDQSVGKKVIEAQKYDLSLAREDVTHSPNQFLHSLSVSPNHKNTKYDVIQFNNTISRSLTNDQKSMLTNEFLRLLTDDNSFFNTVGMELFAYNFFTEGFSRGVNSYSEFVPIELYEHYTDGEGGLNLVDYFREIYQDFNSSENFNINEFLYTFLRNRGTQLRSLKNLSRRNTKQIKDFLKANPRTKTFLFNSGGNLAIGRSLENRKGEYSGIGTLLGVPNLHVEYQSGSRISDTSTALDVLERMKTSENVRETRQSNCGF